MGASLDTPAKCPLCNEQTLEPVVLKCQHRFCRRCIGDLWSISPEGPFRCPEWRCKTEYKRPPFDSSQWRPRPSTSSGSYANDQSSTLERPSLSGRLLGKRKASSAPVVEAPDRKRKSGDTGAADESLYVTASEATEREVDQRSERVTNHTVSKDTPTTETQPEPRREVVVRADEPDSCDEADLCDGPASEAPKKFDAPPEVPTSPKPKVATPSKIILLPAPEQTGNSTVPCHYCPKIHFQRAVKTCLVCGASMCAEHLRPHRESPVFQSHPLVPPVEDISLWRCQEHQEMNRIYCRQCSTCVCTVCTVIGSHRDHACISIRDAERELRGTLKDEIKQLQMSEKLVMDLNAEFSEKKEIFKVALSTSRAGVKQQFRAIREALDQEEDLLLRCVSKEEGRVLGGLQEKLNHLQTSLQDVQKGLQTLEGLADNIGEQQLHDQAFIMEYSKVAQLASDTRMENFEPPEELYRPRLEGLQKWTEKRLDNVVMIKLNKEVDLYRLIYGTVPSLDPDTAHPRLRLSDGGKRVTYSESQAALADSGARFTSFPQVLARQAVASGRCYWEVQVPVDEGRWKVGVCSARMERKGQKDQARLGFNAHSWCVACDRGKVEALHDKVSEPVRGDAPQRVGVLLDFEEGALSFYDVTPGGSVALMHSFKHTFNEPLFPAWSLSRTQLLVCDLFQS